MAFYTTAYVALFMPDYRRIIGSWSTPQTNDRIEVIYL